jgi:hypothetical protein
VRRPDRDLAHQRQVLDEAARLTLCMHGHDSYQNGCWSTACRNTQERSGPWA